MDDPVNAAAASVELRAVSLSYPGVRALDGVDFELRAGEVHALAGTNGAGKSTLVRVLGGVEAPQAGQVRVDGRLTRWRTPMDALRAGVAVLHQETHLVPELDVTENLFLGRERRRGLRLDWPGMREHARSRIAELGLALDVDRPARSLSASEAQLVGLARALDLEARFLVLDEPTSSLDAAEVARLFEVVRALRERGFGLVFVGHSLEQIYALADRITVLREGRSVGTFEAARLARGELVARMLGREVGAAVQRGERRGATSTPALVSARGLGRAGAIEPFDLEVRRGEVLGLAGLLGSGRSELARLLFAADVADRGSLEIDGARRVRSPRGAIDAGLAFCAEDRKRDGIFPTLSVRENVAISAQRRLSRIGRVSTREQRAIAERLARQLGLVAASLEQPIGTLSGGNQQKALLARALACEPRLLILDEPTRGIDVGAKVDVERWIEELAARGTAVVFISSALEEVLRRASRVLVLRDRRVVADLDAAEIDERRLLELLARRDGDG